MGCRSLLKKILCLSIFLCSAAFAQSIPETVKVSAENTRLQDYLANVYKIMDDHYFLPVSKDKYESFLKEYPAEKLIEMNNRTKKTPDFIHLGAGLLVDRLKNAAMDRFTNFVPPEKTKAFKDKAYAVTEDLGIEGKKTKEGFEITRVEKHSQAYEKGIRPGDVVLRIEKRFTLKMSQEDIVKTLSPALGSFTALFMAKSSGEKLEIVLESRSYFRETVFRSESGVPGVLILKITHFNQKTSTDFADEMNAYGMSGIRQLVLDLRHNEGGPPLAAREILGFFLPKDDPLFAIARKKMRPVMLTAPKQPIAYKGPVNILVDRRTGSAAEMFSGMLQSKKIAVLTGQKTAGATYLKSMYDITDGATVFMITSLTFFYDKRVYPPDGLTPDTFVPETSDSLEFVLKPLRG